MSEKRPVPVTTEDCDRCGASLTLMTACEQDDESGWTANVDDTAICDDCGAVHHVHVDDEHGYLQWDESEPDVSDLDEESET